MAKNVAAIVVNPVNGLGLFNYLESFFENEIPYKTFAVAEINQVKTNSGISIETDDVIANLKSKIDEFDALVFACGDAMPKYFQAGPDSYQNEMLEIMKDFSIKNKMMIGHCVAGFLFDKLEAAKGKTVTLHPYIKDMVKNVKVSDQKSVIDDNFYTAETEHAIPLMLPKVIEALK